MAGRKKNKNSTKKEKAQRMLEFLLTKRKFEIRAPPRLTQGTVDAGGAADFGSLPKWLSVAAAKGEQGRREG